MLNVALKFKVHTYKGFYGCDYCKNVLWGLRKQGHKCQGTFWWVCLFFPFYWCKLWKRWFFYCNFSDCGYNAHKQCAGCLEGENCTPDRKLIKQGMLLFSQCGLICAWQEGGKERDWLIDQPTDRQTDRQTDRVRVGALIIGREHGWQMPLTRCLSLLNSKLSSVGRKL